jgi:hypothetical protein
MLLAFVTQPFFILANSLAGNCCWLIEMPFYLVLALQNAIKCVLRLQKAM